MFKKGFLDFEWVNTREGILKLRRNGKLLRGKNVLIWILPWDLSRGRSRPGISITTSRGFKSAASRNLAKRRVIGCIIESRGSLNRGHSYLVECRPGAERENYHKLVIEIRGLLREIS